MASNQQPKYKLYSYWKKLYRQYNKDEYRGSIHRDASMLDRIIDDIGYDRTVEAVRFYFKTKKRGQEIVWFSYNYDKILDSMDAYAKDEKRRERIRQETRERMARIKGEELPPKPEEEVEEFRKVDIPPELQRTCSVCGIVFARERKPGRPPTKCGGCR